MSKIPSFFNLSPVLRALVMALITLLVSFFMARMALSEFKTISDEFNVSGIIHSELAPTILSRPEFVNELSSAYLEILNKGSDCSRLWHDNKAHTLDSLPLNDLRKALESFSTFDGTKWAELILRVRGVDRLTHHYRTLRESVQFCLYLALKDLKSGNSHTLTQAVNFTVAAIMLTENGGWLLIDKMLSVSLNRLLHRTLATAILEAKGQGLDTQHLKQTLATLEKYALPMSTFIKSEQRLFSEATHFFYRKLPLPMMILQFAFGDPVTQVEKFAGKNIKAMGVFETHPLIRYAYPDWEKATKRSEEVSSERQQLLLALSQSPIALLNWDPENLLNLETYFHSTPAMRKR